MSARGTGATDGTSLCLAAMEASSARVATLLSKGLPVDSEDKYGHTALMRAAEYGRGSTVSLLLEKGAEVNYQSSVDGFTALMMAAAYGLNGKEDMVSLLLSKGANPELKNKEGNTALDKAKQFNCVEVTGRIEKHLSITNTRVPSTTEVNHLKFID